MKLIDVLRMIDDTLPKVKGYGDSYESIDIRPNSVFRINLCFMSEEDTWINTYADHPMLIPFYNVNVVAFQPDEKHTLNIWLDLESFVSCADKYQLMVK